MMPDAAAAVSRAHIALGAGQPIVVVNDTDRAAGAELVIAASHVSTTWTSFMVRHTSGYLCAAMDSGRADRLELPALSAADDSSASVFGVSVDAAIGVTTGISAADRATTARVLAADQAIATDVTRPGHLVVIRTPMDGSVVDIPSAAVQLCLGAGQSAVAVTATLTGDDGHLYTSKTDAFRFASEHGLTMITVSQVASEHRRAAFTESATEPIDTPFGRFDRIRLRTNRFTATVLHRKTDSVPGVSIHLACTDGDVFSSPVCECRSALDAALSRLAVDGGYLIYVDETADVPAILEYLGVEHPSLV